MPSGPSAPSAIAEEIVDQLEFLEEVAEERRDPLKMQQACEDFSGLYRALGICKLSGEADTEAFFQHLVQSALTRRFYLQAAAAAGGGEPRYRRASFIDPAFDAVAGRQWRLAADVLAQVSHEWTEGEEYEDDFCYAEAIRCLVTAPDADLGPLLARWEGVLEGGSDGRLVVVKALCDRSASAFAEALRSLLEAHEAKARAIAHPVTGSLQADEATFFPNRWVSVEGLALLALGERRGLDVPDEIPACPALARRGTFRGFQPLGFPYVSFSKE